MVEDVAPEAASPVTWPGVAGAAPPLPADSVAKFTVPPL